MHQFCRASHANSMRPISPVEHDVGLWPMDGVVDPSSGLLHANAAPFGLLQGSQSRRQTSCSEMAYLPNFRSSPQTAACPWVAAGRSLGAKRRACENAEIEKHADSWVQNLLVGSLQKLTCTQRYRHSISRCIGYCWPSCEARDSINGTDRGLTTSVSYANGAGIRKCRPLYLKRTALQ